MTVIGSAPYSESFKKIALFRGLPTESLSRIEARCSWRHYEAEEMILDYLDDSDDVFFILEGEARVSIYSVDGKAVTFSDSSAGDVLGEIAAIDAGPRSASIAARTRCAVAAMPRAVFLEILQSESKVTMALLQHFAAKIRCLTTRIYEFSSLDVANRTRAEVLRLAMLAPREGKSASIAPVPTHAEIASRISTHREAVTRELNKLSKLGIVERRGGALLVKDVDRLSLLVSNATGE